METSFPQYSVPTAAVARLMAVVCHQISSKTLWNASRPLNSWSRANSVFFSFWFAMTTSHCTIIYLVQLETLCNAYVFWQTVISSTSCVNYVRYYESLIIIILTGCCTFEQNATRKIIFRYSDFSINRSCVNLIQLIHLKEEYINIYL